MNKKILFFLESVLKNLSISFRVSNLGNSFSSWAWTWEFTEDINNPATYTAIINLKAIDLKGIENFEKLKRVLPYLLCCQLINFKPKFKHDTLIFENTNSWSVDFVGIGYCVEDGKIQKVSVSSCLYINKDDLVDLKLDPTKMEKTNLFLQLLKHVDKLIKSIDNSNIKLLGDTDILLKIQVSQTFD